MPPPKKKEIVDKWLEEKGGAKMGFGAAVVKIESKIFISLSDILGGNDDLSLEALLLG